VERLFWLWQVAHHFLALTLVLEVVQAQHMVEPVVMVVLVVAIHLITPVADLH